MMLWLTLIYNSDKNPNEYEFFGKANLENKQKPFLSVPDKTKAYIKNNIENFNVLEFKKGSIVLKFYDTQALITFYELSKSVGLDNIIDITINNNTFNFNVNLDIDVNIDIPIVLLASKRFEKIKNKLSK